jgi:hypothetical protein
MHLKTPDGKEIEPKDIDYILRERIMGLVKGTMVRLKGGQEIFLEHSEKEVLDEMNKATNG